MHERSSNILLINSFLNSNVILSNFSIINTLVLSPVIKLLGGKSSILVENFMGFDSLFCGIPFTAHIILLAFLSIIVTAYTDIHQTP